MIRLFLMLAAALAALSARGGDQRVSILVAEPGVEIYELEGHAGLRIIDEEGDYTINWGLFDFGAPGFVYRFVKGETDYSAGAWPTAYFLDSYRGQGRKVVEIELELSPAEILEVKRLVAENLLPENRVYRYNYVKDNCATRPLGIIERATGDSIEMRLPAEWEGEPLTFRRVMRKYHRDYPWYQFGIDLALGSGIDYALAPRELSFAPVLLPPLLASATVNGAPIATKTPVTLVAAGTGRMANPTPWYLTPLAAGILVMCVSLWVSVADIRRRRVSRWLDCILFTLYGLAGCVITFLVFVSVHEATSPNWLIVWLNPFCFIGGWLVWLKSCQKMVLCYHFANFVALLLLAMFWPMLGQVGNIAFIPFVAADAMRSASYIYINQCAIKKPA